MAHDHHAHAHPGEDPPDKQRVAFFSMLASAGLAFTKFFAAIVTGSLGVLSEAIHGIIDFGATIITLFAVRWADQPADDKHHFGHAKVESIAALVETALLFVTTGWIIVEAVKRLMGEGEHVIVTWWAVAIIALSVFIDFNRSRALMKVAKQTGSQALEADALHFSTDMWSSLVVLLGLGAVWLKVPFADSIAALIVSVFIAHAGWDLGKRTLDTLLDTAPDGATDAIRAVAERVPGVLSISQLRIRPAGATLFVNLTADLARTMPVESVNRLRQAVARAVGEAYPGADVLVTPNPVALDSETAFDKIELIAQQRGMAIHHLTVQQIDGRLAVSFDLEVEGDTPLGQAHDQATALEMAVRAELGQDVEVETHIEPQPLRLIAGTSASSALTRKVEARLAALAKRQKALRDIHNVRVRQTEDGLFVHYHCRFPGKLPVRKVHHMVDEIENGLQESFPDLCRVIAHTEPVGGKKHDL
jgi:cation diffusion facilitator family transporter